MAARWVGGRAWLWLLVAAWGVLVQGGDEGQGDCGCAAPSRADSATVDAATGSACRAAPLDRPAMPALTRLHDDVVHIPAGRIRVGVDKPVFAADGEGPSHLYHLPEPGLWMDQYEVTNARFQQFVAATGFVTEAEGYGWSFVHELAVPPATLARVTHSVAGSEWWVPVLHANWRQPEGAESNITWRMDHPVVHVSQRDAAAFCAWAGGRLPSENEWEYAARGGKEGRLLPWGNVLTPTPPGGGVPRHRTNVWQGVFPHNNTGEDGHTWAAPVTAFGPQNGYGLYHMSGNVWEWTSTVWCPQAALALSQARGAGVQAEGLPPNQLAALIPTRKVPECARLTETQRDNMARDVGEIDYVKKGGSFLCHKDTCYRYRVAARHKNTANSSAYNLGFRCVYDSATPPPGRPVTNSGAHE